MMMRNYLCLLFFSLLICSCRKTSSTQHYLTDSIIRDYGKYIDQKTGLTLVVWNKDGLLKYSLIKKRDTILIQNENASIYHNWFLYMDKNDNLWVSSSDIGSWVSLNENGKYKKVDIVSAPKHVLIPKRFFSELPDGLKKRLNAD